MSYPRTFPRPKPKIEKIVFTQEEQEEINCLLEGRPTKEMIEKKKKRGISIVNWQK